MRDTVQLSRNPNHPLFRWCDLLPWQGREEWRLNLWMAFGEDIIRLINSYCHLSSRFVFDAFDELFSWTGRHVTVVVQVATRIWKTVKMDFAAIREGKKHFEELGRSDKNWRSRQQMWAPQLVTQKALLDEIGSDQCTYKAPNLHSAKAKPIE